MEKYRIVYHDQNGNPGEAIIEAEEGQLAVDQVEDIGLLHSVESLGPVDGVDDGVYEEIPSLEGEQPEGSGLKDGPAPPSENDPNSEDDGK